MSIQSIPNHVANRSAAFAMTAALLSAVYFALPSGAGVETLRLVALAVGAGAILLGVTTHRPSRQFGWTVITVSFLFEAVATAIWSNSFFAGEANAPAIVEVFRLIAALVLAVALLVMKSDGAGDHDVFGPVEIAIVSIAVGVGVWLLVIEPYVSERSLPFGDKAWAVAMPLLVAIGFAVALRTVVQLRFRVTSPIFLMLGLGVLLVGTVLRSIFELNGSLGAGGLVGSLSIAAPLLVGAAALDPTMAPRHRPKVEAGGLGRVVGFSVAAMTPLTVLFALTLTDLGSRTTRIVAAACAFVVIVLALARMWGLVALVRTLTERRGQDRLAAMVEHSSDVVMLVDESGDIRYASPGLSTTLGHRSTDWIGRPINDLVTSIDRPVAESELERLLEMGTGSTVKFEASLMRVDGQRRRMEATIANLLGGEAVDGLVATFRDVTEQRDLEMKLSHRAFHDELTGLANRALFLDRMDHALQVARPETDPVVVLFVDLDDFKGVNDALGHGVGDELLTHIANRIREATTTGDTPARLGGDEFAVLLEDRGGVDRAVGVAESILERLSESVTLAGYDLAVGASVGVAVASPGMTTSDLLRDADIAMYEAKRAGKGQIKFFDPAMGLGAAKHLEYRSELGHAIDDGQLRLVFQPQIDMGNGEVIGAEALLRWRHPERGEISPAEFIPIAERSGLIVPLGAWVLDESVRHAKQWQHSGPREMSVNVSAVQLRNVDFVNQVRASLVRHGLAPEQLVLEVTETVLVGQIETASQVLNDLKELGVKIAIDDFGTGYCSLSYLQRFPVDIVKIDKQFIDEVGGDHKSTSLATMILQMTSSLGIVSVAEGIERADQLAELRRMGCDVGQGFLLSRPLESDVIRTRFGLGVRNTSVDPPVLVVPVMR